MATPKMPSVDIINFEGLYTKQNPETLQITQLRECKNGDFFREYGSLSKIKGNSKVLDDRVGRIHNGAAHWRAGLIVPYLRAARSLSVLLLSGPLRCWEAGPDVEV